MQKMKDSKIEWQEFGDGSQNINKWKERKVLSGFVILACRNIQLILRLGTEK